MGGATIQEDVSSGKLSLQHSSDVRNTVNTPGVIDEPLSQRPVFGLGKCGQFTWGVHPSKELEHVPGVAHDGKISLVQ